MNEGTSLKLKFLVLFLWNETSFLLVNNIIFSAKSKFTVYMFLHCNYIHQCQTTVQEEYF